MRELLQVILSTILKIMSNNVVEQVERVRGHTRGRQLFRIRKQNVVCARPLNQPTELTNSGGCVPDASPWSLRVLEM